MTHIANWVRSIFDATDGVYISRETPSHSRMRPLSGYPIRLEMSSTESNDTKPGHVNPPTRSSERGGSLAGPLPHLAGYKLWPSRQSKSAQVEVCIPILQNRSPSSLSDTSPSSKGGLWLRGTSLARRRKISVPELRGTATLDNITKAQGLDSRKLS